MLNHRIPTPRPFARKLSQAIFGSIKSAILFGLYSLSPLSQAQQVELPQASDIDWLSLEELSPALRATVLETCCGLYIEPEIPTLQGELGSIELSAGESIVADDNAGNSTIRLEEDVEILQQDRFIQADHGLYNRSTEIFDLSGNIRIRQPGLLLIGTDAVIDQGQQSSQINNASYVMHNQSIRGSAEIVVYTDADGIITIDNGLFTRCEPGDNSWVMSGDKITLNQEEGRGVARNVTLRIKGLPVFYSPYMSFPIDDKRVSGFLAPTIGSTRDGGLDFSIPYYFNLAPHYDATLSPRILTDRGLMMNLEGRYRGQRSSNLLTMAYLPGDNLYDEATAGLPGLDAPPVKDRWLLDYNYRGRLSSNWGALIDYSSVSDRDYFQDLGDNGLNNNTLSYLTRYALLNYRANNWKFSSSARSYQVIDPTISQINSPYDSLPRFNFDSLFSNDLGLQYGLDAEYIYFDRSMDRSSLSQGQIDNGILVSGQRVSIEPVISWPFSTPGTFFTPTMKYKYAQYQLDDQAINTADQQSRGIFMTSIDSGLIFERDFSFGSSNYRQTLEPRLFYLYSEYEDQSDIPVFDSADMTFSFNQLFREDRFSGKDRVGDSNQLTLALSSNIFSNTGQQKARFSIGQIFYLEDRKVTLRNNPNTARLDSLLQADSATAGEFSYRFNDNWRISTYLEWNTNTHSMDAGSFQFRYQSDINHILNFSYRYRDQLFTTTTTGIDRSINQTDISGVWPLKGNWELIARWNYDHANKRNLESIVGVGYDTCCWKVRLVAREWIDQDQIFIDNIEDNAGIFLQFELKGLGNVLGGSVTNILSDGISGFREQ